MRWSRRGLNCFERNRWKCARRGDCALSGQTRSRPGNCAVVRGHSATWARHHSGPQRRNCNWCGGNRRPGIAPGGWYLSQAGGPFLACAPSIEAYKSEFRLWDLRTGIEGGDNGTKTADRIGTHATAGICMIANCYAKPDQRSAPPTIHSGVWRSGSTPRVSVSAARTTCRSQ